MPHIKLNIPQSHFNDTHRQYLYDYSHRYELWYGTRGSGKSFFVTDKVLIKALTSKRTVLVIRKVARTLRDSIWLMFINRLKKLQVYDLCKVREHVYEIVLPNGSVLIFKGIDDGDKLKSTTDITDVLIEEADELERDDFSQLDMILRARAPHLQLYMLFNPTLKAHWIYKYFFGNGTPPDTIIHFTSYLQNRFLPEANIKAIEAVKDTNPNKYKRWVLGEFGGAEGLIFPTYQTYEFNHTEIKGTHIFGLDFGFINDDSVLLSAIATKDTLYIYDEHCATGMTNDVIAKLIKDKGLAKEIIIADSAEPKSIEEIKRHGIPRIRAAAKGPDSIMHGIQRLLQYKLVVHPSCTNTIKELDNYSWQKDKLSGEYTEKPVDIFNHSIDALRYAIQIIDNPAHKLQTLPISF